MNSPQDTNRTASSQGAEPRSTQQAGDASPAPEQQRQPSSGAGSPGQAPPQSGDTPDAVPGRQYQGSGVMNKSGRFGSSQGPEDLAGPADSGGDEGGKKA